MRVLVTGGAGYIGAHTVLELAEAGHRLLVVDNLCNSSTRNIQTARAMTGRDIEFRRADIRDRGVVSAIVAGFKPDAVVHIAGLKDAGIVAARKQGRAAVASDSFEPSL